MSKVIRIADSVFERLQRLAQPFVDTPSDVVERLLDDYDGTHGGASEAPSPLEAQRLLDTDRGPQLYLVPAIRANARETLKNEVEFDLAAEVLDLAQVSALRESLGGRKPFRCWAMSENSRAYWESMERGDMVLFTLKGTGRFNFKARVLTKIESAPLGERIWPVVPGDPWKLIYVLGDVEEISVEKGRMVQALGYDKNYVVPGAIRVDPSRLRVAIEKHGNLDRLLSSVTEE